MAKPPLPSGESRASISAALTRIEDRVAAHWRSTFLAALSETSNVTAAAEAAGVRASRAYKVRRQEPDFARAWQAALLEGYDALEIDVLHRLRFGEARDADRKFDNASALRLVAQHREAVARERAMRENEDVATVRTSLDAKLASLRQQVVARREKAPVQVDAADG